MIVYFSGTGNSGFVAHRLGKQLGEETVRIGTTDAQSISFKGETLGFIVPVYAWGIPPIVMNWVRRLTPGFCEEVKAAGGYVWVALTCGDETGMAPEMMEEALREVGLEASGVWSVQMPNVYVLLPGFDVDTEEVNQSKLDLSLDRVRAIGDAVGKRVRTFDVVRGSMPKLKTRLVYPLFKRWGINTCKWHWTKECIMCGACAAACPVHNIKMQGGHPSWGRNCTSCLACYHVCPTHAVQYGGMTKHRGQYYLRRFKE